MQRKKDRELNSVGFLLLAACWKRGEGVRDGGGTERQEAQDRVAEAQVGRTAGRMRCQQSRWLERPSMTTVMTTS